MRMSNIINDDDFNPKKIYEDLIEGCLSAKEHIVSCVVDEVWFPNGTIPFDMSLKDGIYTLRVIAPNRKEALKRVSDFLPVITFLGENDGS